MVTTSPAAPLHPVPTRAGFAVTPSLAEAPVSDASAIVVVEAGAAVSIRRAPAGLATAGSTAATALPAASVMDAPFGRFRPVTARSSAASPAPTVYRKVSDAVP